MLSAPFFPEELRGLASSLPPRAGGICFELTPPKAFRIGETVLGCVFWVRPVVSPGVSLGSGFCADCVFLFWAAVFLVCMCVAARVFVNCICVCWGIFSVFGVPCVPNPCPGICRWYLRRSKDVRPSS